MPDLKVVGVENEPSAAPLPLVAPRVEAPVPVVVDAETPSAEQDFCWAHVTGSFRRERAVEGLLLGVSVGDALGLARQGLTRRTSLRMFGRGPLNYALIPNLGLPSADTHRLLMTMQSILRCRSQLDSCRRNFATRLRFYVLSLPLAAGRTTLLASLRLCLGASPDQSGIESNDNGALVSALALATALQGTGHSVERWAAIVTEVTHVSPEAVESSVLLARAAYLALMTEPDQFSTMSLIERLIQITEDPTLSSQLKELQGGLAAGKSVHQMAKHFGWKDQIPPTAMATALMAIYAWMTHHDNYERAVEQAILLGGDAPTLGALTGGLAGIHLGAKAIPSRWLDRLWGWPNTRRWMESLTRRFIDWPHGSEDLHRAPSNPSRPLGLIVRSVISLFAHLLGAIIRAPWKLGRWVIGD